MHVTHALFLLAVLLLGVGVCDRAAAQDLAAEVRTWSGRTVRLGQASFEVQYTILPKQQEQGAPGGPSAGMYAAPTMGSGGGYGGASVGGSSSPGEIFRSLRAFEQSMDRGPAPIQARRGAYNLTLYQGGLAQEIPLSRVATLTFRRQLVPDSTLPPYLARSHYVYAAQATLTDGATIDGEYVNLGTALLRGATIGGLVEIPWHEIEVVRFTR